MTPHDTPTMHDNDLVTRQIVALSAPGGPLANLVTADRLPPAFWRCWGTSTLSRPMVLPKAELAAAVADIIDLFDLLARLPERLFGGNLTRYGDALGIDQRAISLVARYPIQGRTRFGRADTYHDGTSLRLLEFNVGSDVGGLDHCVLQQMLLPIPAFRAFAEQVKLDFVHTGQILANDLRAAAGMADPVVAVLCAPGGLRRFWYLLEAFAEMMRDLGMEIALAEVTEAEVHAGRVTVGGQRIDIALRFFTVDDVIGDPEVFAHVEPLLRAALDGSLVFWTPLDSTLLSNKGALALLSSPACDAVLSDRERALVRRIMPESRVLADGSADLLNYCRRHRRDLILKPMREFGGTGIVPGWSRSADEWDRELRRRAGRGHVVQRRVRPRYEPVIDPVTHELQEWVAAWGIFLTPSGYAGVQARTAPANAADVVNYSKDSPVRIAAVFTHESTVT